MWSLFVLDSPRIEPQMDQIQVTGCVRLLGEGKPEGLVRCRHLRTSHAFRAQTRRCHAVLFHVFFTCYVRVSRFIVFRRFSKLVFFLLFASFCFICKLSPILVFGSVLDSTILCVVWLLELDHMGKSVLVSMNVVTQWLLTETPVRIARLIQIDPDWTSRILGGCGFEDMVAAVTNGPAAGIASTSDPWSAIRIKKMLFESVWYFFDIFVWLFWSGIIRGCEFGWIRNVCVANSALSCNILNLSGLCWPAGSAWGGEAPANGLSLGNLLQRHAFHGQTNGIVHEVGSRLCSCFCSVSSISL